ncbi:MAG: tRNA pseudouridine(13) synthase TruD [Candidatus Altiarchaeales archaeon IMC4]|nr:MAG: tRNA pseudouridine(13) synthase TruD [Candidatus Altiarchaeales archaeon IMC4]
MKLRQKIEDFRVEEVGTFGLQDTGKYKLYLLEKRGLESFALLSYLSKENRIPRNSFGFAGLKDKYAVTRQYLTVPSQYEIKTLNERNFNITLLGFVKSAVKIGDSAGNRFEITARDIKGEDLQEIDERASSLKTVGVPNYFDSQRFGSVVKNKFIARSIVKKDYEEAVRLFLTGYARREKAGIKHEKIHISKNWDNVSNLNIKNLLFARIIDEYKKTGSWLCAYKRIPCNLREMFALAYQSYLWNECVKLVLKCALNEKKIYGVEYNLGELLFYNDIGPDELKKIPETFKTICLGVKPSEFEEKIINEVLSREGVTIDDFDIKKETEMFFGVYERNTIVTPADFKISPPEVDELNDNGKNKRFKLAVNFTLPKGCYATVVTKRIFNN